MSRRKRSIPRPRAWKSANHIPFPARVRRAFKPCLSNDNDVEPGVLPFPGLHVEAFGLEGHRQFSARRHARFHPHRIASGNDVGEVHGLLNGQAPILNAQDGLRRVGKMEFPPGGRSP